MEKITPPVYTGPRREKVAARCDSRYTQTKSRHTKEPSVMPDAVRKVLAILILVIGVGLVWACGRSSSNGAEAAINETEATLAAAREHAASQDPRLKGAYSFE